MSPIRVAAQTAVVAFAGLALAACGGGDSPASPSPPPGGGGGGGGTATNTITINAQGSVNPANVVVAVGTRVTFVNNDSRSHLMSSNPHPVHTDCPELNIEPLQPGQSRETGVIASAKTCGFHDHDNPTSSALMGTIRAQ